MIVEVAQSNKRLFAEMTHEFTITCMDLQMRSQACPVNKFFVAVLMWACKDFLLDHLILVYDWQYLSLIHI